MNDFDRTARFAVKSEPEGTKRWLLPRVPRSLAYQRWLDSQSAPRPGEPDRRCDTIMELADGFALPWAFVIELFTEADADALDRAMEYQARFRAELRHGPHGRDKYFFASALIFLTGRASLPGLDMRLPGMPSVGSWFGPRVLELCDESAVARADAVAQKKLARWLLVWLPLMRGGQTVEMARRFRELAQAEPRFLTMWCDVVLTFARLTGCVSVYRGILEEVMFKTAPLFDEVRAETRRQDTLEVLDARFPGAVPAAIRERVTAETDLPKLGRWIKLAGTATTPEAFLAEMG